jgi:hypothetical protein
MNDKERIEALKSTIDTAQVQLAELLKEPKRVPKAGDVFIAKGGQGEICIAINDGSYVIIDSEGGAGYHCDNLDAEAECHTLKGTFDEVYVLRSEVDKDYVSKEKIKKFIGLTFEDSTCQLILSSLLYKPS